MSVYFATCRQTGTVKIGSSLEPYARLKELQTAHPFELKIEAILPGGTDEEWEYHRRFADERLKGEWFKLSEMIELIIKNNPAPPPPDFRELERAARERMKNDPREQRYRQVLADARENKPIPKPRSMPTGFGELNRNYRKRIAEGDICFPFRGKNY
jgi:hypothetical protein